MPIQQIKKTCVKISAYIQTHQIATIATMLVVCGALALWRRPETIILAQFWAEDGRYWYAQAYNYGLSSFFSPYAGYFVVAYRLVAMAALALPLYLAPVFFNLVALGFQLLPIVLLCSNRLKFIPKRWIGVILSLLYIGVPNASEVFTNLTNIQWHLGVAAFLVLLAAPSQRLAWRIFDYAVLIATGLSGPLVIILAPIALCVWWRHKTAHHRNKLILLIVLSVIQCLSIFILSGEQRVGAADPNLWYLVHMIVGQIMTGGLLGQANVDLAYGHNKVLVGLLIAGLVMVAYAVIRGPWWLKLANLYSAMLIVAMLASLKPVPGLDPWQGLTNPGGGQRYWYIPILIWIATLIWLAFKARLPLLRGVAITGLSLLLLVGIPTNWHIAPWPYQHFDSYARQFEQLPPGATLIIPVNPGWEMTLIKK